MIYHNRWYFDYGELGLMTDNEFLKRLGKSIATARKSAGLSQSELGAKVNMETSNLSAIENGRQNASSLTLKRLADAMDVEVLEFFEF